MISKNQTTDVGLREQKIKAEMIIHHEYCKKRFDRLRERLKEVGCEVPEDGFSSKEETLAWKRKYFREIIPELKKSQEYKRKIEEITSGKDELSDEELNKKEEFMQEFIPDPEIVFKNILDHFNVDTNLGNWRYFMHQYFFLKKKRYPLSPYKIRESTDEDTGEIKLHVRIYGHTRKKDICENWGKIKEMQKGLPNYQKRSKDFENIERDMDVFGKYKKIKNEGTEEVYDRVDEQVYSELNEKYPDLGLGQIRDIYSKVKKKLGLKIK